MLTTWFITVDGSIQILTLTVAAFTEIIIKGYKHLHHNKRAHSERNVISRGRNKPFRFHARNESVERIKSSSSKLPFSQKCYSNHSTPSSLAHTCEFSRVCRDPEDCGCSEQNTNLHTALQSASYLLHRRGCGVHQSGSPSWVSGCLVSQITKHRFRFCGTSVTGTVDQDWCCPQRQNKLVTDKHHALGKVSDKTLSQHV